MGELSPEDPEVKVSAATVSVEQEEEDAVMSLIDRSSSWRRLTRVMAWILRVRTLLWNSRKRREVTGGASQLASDVTGHKDALDKEKCLSLEEIKEAD